MSRPIKVLTVFGTRPEAIKMAPLVLELKKRSNDFETSVAVTAQHREMLDQVLSIFDIRPDYDLNVMKKKQTLAHVTTGAMEGLDEVMKEAAPDIILVHGDTTTTFVASLTGFYNQIPVAHVEAGLRTWDKKTPFPEEMNRQLTGVLADLHFAPTNQARDNLLLENKREDQIFVTGNTAIDSLKTTVDEAYSSKVFDSLEGRRLVLMTAHRRENLGMNMKRMFRAVKRIVETHKDVVVVYPVHLNPEVQETAEDILGGWERIKLISPLDVIDFHNFASRAHLILTDSGGVQEEAPSLGVPVLVLRDTTERPEGIDAGTIKLAGTDEENIFRLADELLSDPEAHAKMSGASNPYGDGQASARIAEGLRYFFGKTDRKPAPFEIE
ncbi:non-hydrolyzing UDP-N-acetylglucosamine 2-epimerase [Salimicrobium salexigens]|uniref:UDP-N-acetylglucosamine 2-epimerase (non-hydrolyzing) n=1 Tax=Salimicrobium salexigens TaxID=908941 RepID=A0ABY1KV28_9BACI|nr:UDP-N-acetylglucosamine 2-epimerase (non-hydrolyzing) [Salimicrobium salexigens]SIS82034.1 UDP-N-Acetylglucosamine 2-epimerase [Salimicrobium salexigens]